MVGDENQSFNQSTDNYNYASGDLKDEETDYSFLENDLKDEELQSYLDDSQLENDLSDEELQSYLDDGQLEGDDKLNFQYKNKKLNGAIKALNSKGKILDIINGFSDSANKWYIVFMKGFIIFILFATVFRLADGAIDWYNEAKNANPVEGNTEIMDFLKKEDFYEYSKNTMSETGENYSATLTSGDYKVGVHIPQGTYAVKAINGDGTFKVSDTKNNIFIDDYGFEFNEDKSAENIEYRNVQLFDGAIVDIQKNNVVELISENAQTSTLKKLEPNTVKETFEIKDGYIAGIDFPEGTYDVELTSIGAYGGDMQIYRQGVIDMKRVSIESTTSIHKNIELPKGANIAFKSVEVKFTTSEFNTVEAE